MAKISEEMVSAFEANVDFFDDFLSSSEATVVKPDGEPVRSLSGLIAGITATTPPARAVPLPQVVFSEVSRHGVVIPGAFQFSATGFTIPATGNALYGLLLTNVGGNDHKYPSIVVSAEDMRNMAVTTVGGTVLANTIRFFVNTPEGLTRYLLARTASNELLLAIETGTIRPLLLVVRQLVTSA